MTSRILTAGAMAIAVALMGAGNQQLANAAEPGSVPSDQLAQFGLGQMEVLSDSQGSEIRGSGFYYFGYGHHFYLGAYYYGPFYGHYGYFPGRGPYGYGRGHGQGRLFHPYLVGSKGFRRFLHVISHGHGGHHD